MDALMAYGSGSDENDNGEQQPRQQQSSSREEGDNSREIPVSETSTITTMDLPPSSRLPLPLELNCEIFKCLKLPIQRKFIWGLGRDIYGMFGQKLLKKTKRVRNPHGNRWNPSNTTATIAANGLNVVNNNFSPFANVSDNVRFPNIFAEQAFPTSGPLCRVDEFPGTICYYYEVKCFGCWIGLSDGVVPAVRDADDNLRPRFGSWIGFSPNSYAMPTVDYGDLDKCFLAGSKHPFELPEGVVFPPGRKEFGFGNVYGCGLVLNPENNLAIFFTVNGELLCRKIPISPTVDRLFPTVRRQCEDDSFEANFGNDPSNPFEYDINNCPGLGLASI